MKTKFKDFINESISDVEIDSTVLNNFIKQLNRLKHNEYLKTVIGFYPITTIECNNINTYTICFWYRSDDIFLEEPKYYQTITITNLKNDLDYIKKFIGNKSINDLLSNFVEMGKKKF